MRSPRARSATIVPMLPRPMIPSTLLHTSVPSHFSRSQRPARTPAAACGTLRARASSSVIACSAVVTLAPPARDRGAPRSRAPAARGAAPAPRGRARRSAGPGRPSAACREALGEDALGRPHAAAELDLGAEAMQGELERRHTRHHVEGAHVAEMREADDLAPQLVLAAGEGDAHAVAQVAEERRAVEA